MIESVSGTKQKQRSVFMDKVNPVHFAEKIKSFLLDKGWVYIIVGFLLGRAVILSEVSPFAVAYLATVWSIQRSHSPKVMLALIAGALTHSVMHSLFVTTSLIIFVLLAGLFKRAGKQPVLIPVFIFVSTITARLFLHSITGVLSVQQWMLLLVEGVLAAVLVLIFMQSIPLLSPKKYRPILKNEEIVSMIILLASILTGTIGWELYGAAFEQVFSRYIVLMLAFVGGAAIGSTVGVVAGLILSLANVADLYQMSLLAFSGLLGGLLKEGKKIGVSMGLLVGTFLVGIYGNTDVLMPSLIESLAAVALFIMTPAGLFKKISRYIPGTDEYTDEQEQYLQKIRNVTAKRVEQFSDVFQALSKSFSGYKDHVLDDEKERQETDYFLSKVTESTCQLCFMKDRCWSQQFDKTYNLMESLKSELSENHAPSKTTRRQFENYCVKSDKVIDTMKDELSFFEANRQLKKQVMESKRFVADQLQGVSEVMDDFSQEILKERQQHEKQEADILEALEDNGIELEKLDIFHLDKGNIDIEMVLSFYEYHGEGPKIIAPLLSSVLDEIVVVKQEEISPFPNGYCYLAFGSAKEYVVKTGIAGAAKGGGIISGDSHTTMELGEGKYAMAISDGMGNGSRAREESGETLRLLQQILHTGIPETVAIKTINSILALRTTDEMYATLDLAVVNLHNAAVQFLKIGSMPSFVKRGDDIFKIEASNLPMGIIEEFDVDTVHEQLQSGDLLIMMSDGIFEGPKHVQNADMWIKRKIYEMTTQDPQSIADLLLEEVVRTRGGEIADDMTVVVAKIDKHIPEWSAIPAYQAEAR